MQELKVYGSTASSVEVVLVTGVMNTFVVVCWFDKTCVAEYTDHVCSAWRSGCKAGTRVSHCKSMQISYPELSVIDPGQR